MASDSIDTLRAKLRSIGQEQVLRFYDRLDEGARAALVAELPALDLDAIADLAEKYVRNKPHIALPREIKPAAALPLAPHDARQYRQYADAEQRGRQMLGAGQGADIIAPAG